MMTTEEEETYTIPTAPFTVTLKGGRQVLIEDLPDNILKKMAYKEMRSLRKAILRLAGVKAEMDKRGYEEEPLSNFTNFKDYNIWQIVTHATLLSLNSFNNQYPNALKIDARPDGEEE